MLEFFQKRLEFFEKQQSLLHQKAQNLSLIRFVFFIFSCTLLVWLANERQAIGLIISTFVLLPIFLILVKRHLDTQKTKQQTANLIQINQEEQQRLEDNWLNLPENGIIFQNSEHFYTADFDFFGKKSLFQYLNRAETFLGKEMLSRWLLAPAAPAEIWERQTAIAELQPLVDFRQKMQMLGREQDTKAINLEKLADFKAWFESPDPLSGQKILMIGVWILPIFFWASVAGFFLQITPFWAIFPFYFLNYFALNSIISLTKFSEKQVQPIGKLLKILPTIFQLIENHNFTSEKLLFLQKKLFLENRKASEELRGLGKTIELLDYKRNWVFALFVTVPFLFEWHIWRKLEKYKGRLRAVLAEYWQVIGEMEALNSLAAFAFANPDTIFPEILEEKNFVLATEQIGHPLISPKKRICNDFILKGLEKSIVLTGSNMSGKSTFLRTLGVNVAMALAGGVVCAKKMQVSPCELFSSMRTQDSLADETSAFYAELKRLKKLIDYLGQNSRPIFYLLDEVLKGTNSQDRREGTKGLLEKLLPQNAFGIVATHDLEVAEWALEQETVRNYSFNSRIEGDQILFDYRLCEGICRGFNAEKLMQLMGIVK